jgi:hypothetical protein
MHPPDFDQRKTIDDLHDRLSDVASAVERTNSKLDRAQRFREMVLGGIIGALVVLLIFYRGRVG